MDDHIGKLRQTLASVGHADDTAILYHADHGCEWEHRTPRVRISALTDGGHQHLGCRELRSLELCFGEGVRDRFGF